MGKGYGPCLSKTPEKTQAPAPATAPATTAPAKPAPAAPAEQVKPANGDHRMATTKVYIVFYSMYGHIHKLAQEMKKGVDSVDGCEGILFQVPETLAPEVLEKMHAPPKPDVPVLEDVHELTEADGFLFGTPTRFGLMAAQMKAFWDRTGGLWQSGGLVGKPAGIFFSTASQNGGQETTALTTLTQFTHHGMIYVPPGYTYGSGMFEVEKAHGGSPYGAGTLAGPDGSRQPTEYELGFAEHQGKYFAGKAKLLAGK